MSEWYILIKHCVSKTAPAACALQCVQHFKKVDMLFTFHEAGHFYKQIQLQGNATPCDVSLF